MKTEIKKISELQQKYTDASAITGWNALTNALNILEQSSKRLFQILDDMNVEDGEKGTALVAVCNAFISADKVKGGAKISMGAPLHTITDIATDKVIPILLLIDREEYFKRNKQLESK